MRYHLVLMPSSLPGVEMAILVSTAYKLERLVRNVEFDSSLYTVFERLFTT